MTEKPCLFLLSLNQSVFYQLVYCRHRVEYTELRDNIVSTLLTMVTIKRFILPRYVGKKGQLSIPQSVAKLFRTKPN